MRADHTLLVHEMCHPTSQLYWGRPDSIVGYACAGLLDGTTRVDLVSCSEQESLSLRSSSLLLQSLGRVGHDLLACCACLLGITLGISWPVPLIASTVLNRCRHFHQTDEIPFLRVSGCTRMPSIIIMYKYNSTRCCAISTLNWALCKSR